MSSFWMLSWLAYLSVMKIHAVVETTRAAENRSERVIKFECAGGSSVDDECECEEMKTMCKMQPCLKAGEYVQRRYTCDGLFDCSDLSDECLCDRRTGENADTFDVCKQLFTDFSNSRQCAIDQIHCDGKRGNVDTGSCAKREEFCDRVTHCEDGTDERFCRTKDVFANESNSVSRLIGLKQYFFCGDFSMTSLDLEYSGYDDGRWVFIDWRRRFDGIRDCDDASDEWHPNFVYCGENGTDLTISRCPEAESAGKRILASPDHLVENALFSAIEWFLGVAGFIGNSLVVFHSSVAIYRRKKCLHRRRHTGDGEFSSDTSVRLAANGGKLSNHVLVVFLCISDWLLAAQILLMAFANEYFRGRYWQHDEVWQSGSACALIGSLAIFSVQASTFMIVVISFVRLYVVLQPFKSLKLKHVIWASAFTYLLAALLMFIPHMTFAKPLERYFIRSAYVPNNPQADATVLERDKAEDYVRKIVHLHSPDKLVDLSKLTWDEMEQLVRHINPQFANWRYFGYYSQISICIPPIVARWTDPGLRYSFTLLVINFLAFLLVFGAYYVIFQKTRKGKECSCLLAVGCCAKPFGGHSTPSGHKDLSVGISAEKQRCKSLTRDEEDYEMQKRILWIIGTNFACWSPICMLTLFSIISPEVKSEASVLSAMFLVQINCVVNPLVYSRKVRRAVKRAVQKCFGRPCNLLLEILKIKECNHNLAKIEYDFELTQVTLESVVTADKSTSTVNPTSSIETLPQIDGLSNG